MLAALMQDKQGCEPEWRAARKVRQGEWQEESERSWTQGRGGLKATQTGKEDPGDVGDS